MRTFLFSHANDPTVQWSFEMQVTTEGSGHSFCMLGMQVQNGTDIHHPQSFHYNWKCLTRLRYLTKELHERTPGYRTAVEYHWWINAALMGWPQRLFECGTWSMMIVADVMAMDQLLISYCPLKLGEVALSQAVATRTALSLTCAFCQLGACHQVVKLRV